MKSIRGVFAIFSVLVFGMTLWFVVAREPEERVAKSDDGVVTITGLSRIKGNFSVDVEKNATVATPLVSHVYHIAPADAPQDSPLVLSFARSALFGTSSATSVYWFNAQLGMWEQVHDVVADSEGVLAVRVSRLGDFALGIAPKIIVPTMLTAFDALRTKAPVGTRGYNIAVAYTLDGGVPVRVEGLGEHGGCGGRIGAGDHSEYSSSSIALSIPVDDVDTRVAFTFVGEWAVSANGTGCEAPLILEARDETLLNAVNEQAGT